MGAPSEHRAPEFGRESHVAASPRDQTLERFFPAWQTFAPAPDVSNLELGPTVRQDKTYSSALVCPRIATASCWRGLFSNLAEIFRARATRFASAAFSTGTQFLCSCVQLGSCGPGLATTEKCPSSLRAPRGMIP